jgi:hypothetical protein
MILIKKLFFSRRVAEFSILFNIKARSIYYATPLICPAEKTGTKNSFVVIIGAYSNCRFYSRSLALAMVAR